jgi:membrane-bound metal-dependent hydrolase YbcI (DUF457 family)
MTHEGHSTGGILISAGVGYVALGFTIPVALFVAVAAFASLIPDLSHKGSWISFRLPLLNWLYRKTLTNWMTRRLLGEERAKRLSGHRIGITHSLVGLFVSTAVVGYVLWQVALLIPFFGIHHAIYPEGWMESFHVFGHLMPYVALITTAWFVGYASHLVLDMLTYSGVALFFPLSDRAFGLLPRPLRLKMRGWGISDG